MPEYLSPGVYVEEVSFRSKSIEGVPTSTTGFAGMTRTGPVFYNHGSALGPSQCEPRLITSWTEFERVFGGLDSIQVGSSEASAEDHLAYVGHAVRAFFDNGGQRVYIARVFVPRADTAWDGVAGLLTSVGTSTASWRARWPGKAGNVLITTKPRRSGNLVYVDSTTSTARMRQVKSGSVVELNGTALYVVAVDTEGVQTLIGDAGPAISVSASDVAILVEVDVAVFGENDRAEQYGALSTAEGLTRAITRILEKDDPESEDASVWLDLDSVSAADRSNPYWPALLMRALLDGGTGAWTGSSGRLSGGHDGELALPADLAGKAADPDFATIKATGLEALAEIDDIAIVALPDGGGYEADPTLCEQAADVLISHATKLRYRIAVVDGPKGSSLNEIRDFRGKFDSKYAAIYHPWVEILDPSARPSQGAPPKRILLPPSGFVTGIYARSDIERGVHKAPANEVVRGITRFEANITKPRQDTLNPEGINALRFFEGRGYRVWGARTISSDPEWKYVNVRRLFAFIEHSIDKGTQWAVFEPNGPRLWANVRRTIEDFLTVLWRDGALLGDKPEQAFFVRCDRSTMVQNDLDNGRLICLIGLAPVKPAEFVIFRIGQWTADAS